MIRTGQGNLLLAQTDALVNTVNCVGVMGKGIALQFRKAFPAMFDAYKRAAETGEVVPGRMHVFHTGDLVGPRLIINFPTKRHWRSPSRLEDVRVGLDDLVRVLRAEGVRSVAIPPLGAGLGGLDWAQVRPLIVEALAPLDDVEVVLWEPGAPPAAANRPDRRQRPGMTAARAMMLALLRRYQLLDHQPTHLEAQKLGYFLEAAGARLDLGFAAQRYGPYSDRLYHMLQTMEGHQIRGLSDRAPQAELVLDAAGVDEAEAWLADQPEAHEHFERVAALIRGFETPYGLELLATAHWVARNDPAAVADVDRCIEGVHAWPVGGERKRKVLRPEHLRIAHARLLEAGWLAA